jgi:hypothetical protein
MNSIHLRLGSSYDGIYMSSLQDSFLVLICLSTDMPPLVGLVRALMNSNRFFEQVSFIIGNLKHIKERDIFFQERSLLMM